jgi:phosphoglucomutase
VCFLHCRYFGKEAAQIIVKLAAGNGFKKIYVGKDAIMATPAMSAFIRRRKAYGEQQQQQQQ